MLFDNILSKEPLSMKNTILFLTLAALPLVGNALEARLTGVLQCGELPSGAEFNMSLCGSRGNVLSFVVTGENLVGLDKESLKLTRLDLGDSSVLRDREGATAYSLWPFPAISKDGSILTFEVKIDSDIFPNAGNLKAEGEVVALSSTGYNTLEHALASTGDPADFDLGSFKINTSHDGNDLQVKITGDLGKLSRLEVKADGKAIESNSSWSMGSSKNLSFKVPAGKPATVVLFEWLPPQRVPVKISM